MDSLANRRFGSWLVFWEDGEDEHGGVLWLCYCLCGTRARVPGALLVSGKSTRRRQCRIGDKETPAYEVRSTASNGELVDVPCGSCHMVPSLTGRCGCS